VTGRFLITGLPRSRTAWWAVVTGALHEPFSHAGETDRWPDCRGVSDSGVAPILPHIIERFAPRTLIIERPMAEVVGSLAVYLSDVEGLDWKRIYAFLGQALCGLRVEHPLIFRLAYSDLSSLETVRSGLAWLKVREPANLEQLLHFNVQSDLSWNIALLRQRAAAA
jgi:hypothetical protein